VHHVGILYDQFMMHGQRNIKFANGCDDERSTVYYFCDYCVSGPCPLSNTPKAVEQLLWRMQERSAFCDVMLP